MTAVPWLAGTIAFLVVLLLVPVVRFLCSRLHLFDFPGPLKIHTRPIPRLGGVALAFALIAGVAAVRTPIARSTWLLFAAFIIVWFSGLVDDLRALHPALRLVVHFIAAALLWYAGWGISLFGNTAGNAAATCLFVVFFINAFNFLDGADGIAAGVSALLAIGYIAALGSAQGELASAIAWSLLGACLAFLLFNFPPAKIFLGDSGSALLGFLAAFLGLALYRGASVTPAQSRLLFPLLVAALPLVDASLAVLRRTLRGTSPLDGDRFHFYDLLLSRGWAPRRVTLTCYGLTVGLVIAGWSILRAGFSEALVVTALIMGGLLAIAVQLGCLRREDGFRTKRAETRLDWREMAARRQRQKT